MPRTLWVTGGGAGAASLAHLEKFNASGCGLGGALPHWDAPGVLPPGQDARLSELILSHNPRLSGAPLAPMRAALDAWRGSSSRPLCASIGPEQRVCRALQLWVEERRMPASVSLRLRSQVWLSWAAAPLLTSTAHDASRALLCVDALLV